MSGNNEFEKMMESLRKEVTSRTERINENLYMSVSFHMIPTVLKSELIHDLLDATKDILQDEYVTKWKKSGKSIAKYSTIGKTSSSKEMEELFGAFQKDDSDGFLFEAYAKDDCVKKRGDWEKKNRLRMHEHELGIQDFSGSYQEMYIAIINSSKSREEKLMAITELLYEQNNRYESVLSPHLDAYGSFYGHQVAGRTGYFVADYFISVNIPSLNLELNALAEMMENVLWRLSEKYVNVNASILVLPSAIGNGELHSRFFSSDKNCLAYVPEGIERRDWIHSFYTGTGQKTQRSLASGMNALPLILDSLCTCVSCPDLPPQWSMRRIRRTKRSSLSKSVFSNMERMISIMVLCSNAIMVSQCPRTIHQPTI